MKKALLFLILLFNFSLSFAGVFTAESEYQQAEFILIELGAMLSDLNEKKIDKHLEKTKNECTKLGFNYNNVLELCISLTNDETKYYEKVNQQNRIHYRVPGIAFGISILSGLLVYASFQIYSRASENQKKIKNELAQLGINEISCTLGCASARVPLGKKIDFEKADRILQQLANSDAVGDNIFLPMAFAVCLLISSAVGINNLRDQLYSAYYFQKWGFIKSRLEWHLKNVVVSLSN